MKKIIQRILQCFGCQLNSLSRSSSDAFVLQGSLIRTREPVIFDIGAHIGEVAGQYRKCFPSAYIHCFEPFPQSFQVLARNTKRDSRIFCHEIAVSEKKGKTVFNTNCSSATNSMLATDELAASYWGKGLLDTTSQIEVPTTTIDDFCLAKNISHIDILKMDVQGAEFFVLMGAKNALTNQRISLIYTELIICPTYKGQRKLHEYLSFFDSVGYNFLDLFNPIRCHNQLIQADVVFLSTSFKKELEHLKKYS